jgi:hypothetical protein
MDTVTAPRTTPSTRQRRRAQTPKTLQQVVARSKTPAAVQLSEQPGDRFEQAQDAMREQARVWSEVLGGIGSLEDLLLM